MFLDIKLYWYGKKQQIDKKKFSKDKTSYLFPAVPQNCSKRVVSSLVGMISTAHSPSIFYK